MMQYWTQLRSRERAMLIAATVVVVFALFYLMVWEPVVKRNAELTRSVQDQRALAVWMRQSAVQVKKLQASTTARPASGQSLLTVIDTTAKMGGLTSTLKRVEPEGSTRVRVWLEQATFDDVSRWVELLQRDFRVRLDTAVIDREAAPGKVTARLVFEEAA